MKRVHILGLILGFVLFCPVTFAATITVNTFEDEISDDDDCSLREAIINSNNNAATHDDCAEGSALDIDVIDLPAGVYCLDATGAHENLSITGDLDIAESLTIQGAGSGSTIIDAGSSTESVGAGCVTELDERILHVTNDDGMGGFSGNPVISATITLTGLTLRGGNAEHATFNVHGGALYMVTTDATFNLSDVVFKENVAQTVDGDAFGGAISVGSGTTLNFEEVTFDSNESLSTNASSLGGAIYLNSDAQGTIVGLLAQNNFVNGAGASTLRGGVMQLGASSNLTITNATLYNNSVSTLKVNAFGGAIYVSDGTVPSPTVLTIQSATFVENAAQDGGVIYDQGTNTTITVKNSVFHDNNSENQGILCIGTIDTGTNNFATDDLGDCTFTAGDPTVEAPILIAIANNGGSLETFGIDDTSPLLDAGDCSGYTVTTDQRGVGFAREVGACDVGAFELQQHTDGDGDGFFAYDADENLVDCDDADDEINPDGTEVCDGADNNCDGDTDEATATDATAWYHDDDGDGFGDVADSQNACDQPADFVADDSDCDDTDSANNPDASEVCDGVDNNCDGDTDEDFSDLGDSCSVGVGACLVDTGEMVCSDDGLSTECNAVAGEAVTEVCDDDVDNDCDGDTDTDDADCVVSGDDDDDDDTAASSGGCQLSNGPVHSNKVVVLSGMGLLALLSLKRRQRTC